MTRIMVITHTGWKTGLRRRTQARTGPGGPGELAWVWPTATLLLLPLLFRRKR